MKSLWLPFTVSNGIFVLLNNVFIQCGIYTSDSRLLKMGTGSKAVLHHCYGIREMFWQFFKTLIFAGGSQFGDATWFLRTLFIISVLYTIVRFLDLKLRKNVVFMASIIIAIAGTSIVCIYKPVLPYGIHTCFAAYIAFLIGYYIEKYQIMDKLQKEKYILLISSFIILVFLKQLGRIEMSKGKVTNILFFCIVSIFGWLFLWNIAILVPKVLKHILGYLGRHTLWILIFHFLSFKIVSYSYLKITDGDMLLLAAFPVIKTVAYLWLPYTIIGLVIPIVFEIFIKKFLSELCAR